jgi:hypothetical protein
MGAAVKTAAKTTTHVAAAETTAMATTKCQRRTGRATAAPSAAEASNTPKRLIAVSYVILDFTEVVRQMSLDH